MSRRSRESLFARLAWSLGAALMLAFGLAAALSISIGSRSLRQSVDQELDSIANLVHLDVERFLASRQAELQLCAEVEAMDDVVVDDSHFRIENELMRVARTYPSIYEELLVTKGAGRVVVASTNVQRIGTAWPVDPAQLLPAEGGGRIGDGPASRPGATGPVLVIARPVRSSVSHDQAGWLVALVRWSAIDDLLRDASMLGERQNARAFAVLMSGERPIAGHAEWLPDPRSATRPSLIHNHVSAHEDPTNRRGDDSFVEVSTGERPAGWRVLVYRDPSEAFAVVRWFAWSVLGAGVLGLLLSAGVAYLLARGFSRRIDHLADGTRRLAAGEQAYRVSDDRRDELGELADAFNRMADVLHAARQGLEHSHAELEGSNRQLQEASRLKDEFLANTSHELRTPLNGILGFLSLVKDGVCDSHDEELDSVGQALECAQNLHALIEDVLEVSRIEAGRLALSTQPVPVAPALERIALDMGPRAAASGLELRCEPPEDGLVVRADEQRLHQVLRHLVDNAIKFTHSGSILVSASAPEGAGHVRITVRDTGVGVAPERQEQLFDRFVQGDGSATRRYGGTGLGLSLVRDLVEMMGGLVNLDSAGLGHGTSVCFTLPLGGGGAAGAPERPGAEAGSTASERSVHDALVRGPEHGTLVLVVEDDPIATSWLESVLQSGGMRTAHADSAERAWLLLRQLNPALVLADHALPHAASARLKSGCDLARHMREHRAVEAIPVLLLTGMEPAWLEREGPLPANVTLLKKPVPRETLLATLRGLTPEDRANGVNERLQALVAGRAVRAPRDARSAA